MPSQASLLLCLGSCYEAKILCRQNMTARLSYSATPNFDNSSQQVQFNSRFRNQSPT